MNTSQTPSTTTTSFSEPGPRHGWRYVVTGLALFAATITLFYVEENWRGQRDWQNCKLELEARGAKLDWNYYIPPPVPADQNIFGVPEMREGFEGRGLRNFPGRLSYPGYHSGTNSGLLNYPGYEAVTNRERIIVADVKIGLPGIPPPSGFTVLQWSDTTNAGAEAARLMDQALGPRGTDPVGFTFMVKRPEDVRPAQIFLECQTAPTIKELEQFLPSTFNPRPSGVVASDEDVRIDPNGAGSYRETILTPLSAADYAAWGATIEPPLAIIRKALQRPYARLPGDYSYPADIPIPNFVTIRTVSQRLGALAECHLLLGQPEKAVDDLTLMHQLCRVLEAAPTGRPMTLVAAMINVAVTGLYVYTVEDGMRMQAWREPQLAAIQKQLKEVNLRPYVVDAFALEQAAACNDAELASRKRLMSILSLGQSSSPQKFTLRTWVRDMLPQFSLYNLVPQGWVYQNMVVCANLQQLINDSMASPDQLVVPHKINIVAPNIDRELARSSPFKILASIAIPNCTKACQIMARNQTMANQAQIACALERYRLAHGGYPSTLEALMPQFIEKIPTDIIGGQQPHYHRTNDGKFLLYSIGWSETDHGGRTGSNTQEGDWIWMKD